MEHSTRTAIRRRGYAAFVILSVVAASAFVVDFGTKMLALSRLDVGYPVAVIGDLLSFTLVFNPGAAFSFAGGVTWVFSLIALAVVVGIIWVARRLRSFGWALGLGLLLGGTLGNLSDRLVPKQGAPVGRPFGQGVVVDFIQVKYFAIFNMADVFITAAVVVFVILIVRGVTVEGTRPHAVDADATTDAADVDESTGSSSAERPNPESGQDEKPITQEN